MAHIPVNPENRDPGFFKKKAEIGLANVDNMSAVEFVSSVSEDIKNLNNKKTKSSKITTTGEYFGGILKTSELSSRISISVGLFNSLDPSDELASFNISFSFYGGSSNDKGNITYTLECPDENPYLSNLDLQFVQVSKSVYVILHSLSFPGSNDSGYFNKVGVNYLDWTEGITKLDASENIKEEISSGIILATVKLNGSSSTIKIDSVDSFTVYDDSGAKLDIDSLTSLSGVDCPTINGVPFIGRKNLLIGNEKVGRNIEVTAFHKDSTREGSGVHDWEVLGNLEKANLSKTESENNITSSSKIPNSEETGYGLVRLSKYKENSGTDIGAWLQSLGEDTDVITVGALKEIVSLIMQSTGKSVTPYCLYLENSENLYNYVTSGSNTLTYNIYSYQRSISSSSSTNTYKKITATTTDEWIKIKSQPTKSSNGNYGVLELTIEQNSYEEERSGIITITQESSNQTLEINVIQSKYEILYGILLDSTPVYESGKSITWDNTSISENYQISFIQSSNIETKGYVEISPSYEIINKTSWITSSFDNNVLTLSAGVNPSSKERTGTIYFIINSNIIIPLNISQNRVSSILSIDGDSDVDKELSYTVGNNETTLTLFVDSNYPWTIDKENLPEWISLSGYSGQKPSGTSSLVLVISKNTTSSQRKTVLTVSNTSGTSRVVNIIQNTRSVYIDINKKDEDPLYQFSSGNTSVSFTIDSNVNWFFDQCPSWLTPSVYDSGKDSTVTSTRVTLSLASAAKTYTEEVVSLAYYNSESDTIYSLRKIYVCCQLSQNPYILPRTPKYYEVSASGGTITPNIIATGYRFMFKYIDPKSYSWIPYISSNDYEEMLKNDCSDGFVKGGSTISNIKLSIKENNGPNERYCLFAVTGENVVITESNLYETPIFIIKQAGNKSILPFIKSSTEEKTGCFSATEGQIISYSVSGTLYKSDTSTGTKTEKLTTISNSSGNWFKVKESGYYCLFTNSGSISNSKITLITPKLDNYSCKSEKTTFELSLASVMNNCWDLYNDTLPDWISLEKITGSDSLDTIKVIVDDNTSAEEREYTLNFFVDGFDKSISSFKISQSGITVREQSDKITSIIPIISGASDIFFTSSAIEVGLSALVTHTKTVTIGTTTYTYTYSEEATSGVTYSTEEKYASITTDSYNKSKLTVSENTDSNQREIIVTATGNSGSINGYSGSITLYQGSSSEIIYRTYENSKIVPDLTEISTEITRCGFKINSDVVTHILKSDGTLSESTEKGIDIDLPVKTSKLTIFSNNSKYNIENSKTFKINSTTAGSLSISFNNYYFELSNGKFITNHNVINLDSIDITINKNKGIYSEDGNTVLSGDTENQNLTYNGVLSKLSSVSILKSVSSSDVSSYFTSSDSASNASSVSLKASISRINSYYLDNKIITYSIKDNEGNIYKYIHFRNLRSTPSITLDPEVTITPSSSQAYANINVSSNIGYKARFWTNNSNFYNIITVKNQVATKDAGSSKITYTNSKYPTRNWYKKYSTDRLILNDSDNYGLLAETSIIYKEGFLSTRGFKISTTDDEIITNFGQTASSYNLEVSPVSGVVYLNLNSYEPVTIISNSNNNFYLSDNRTSIEKTVGSLNTLVLPLNINVNNTTSITKNLGYIQVTSPTRTFKINVKQKAVSGTGEFVTPSNRTIVLYTDTTTVDIAFTHSYPGWYIGGTNSGSYYSYDTYSFPSFGEKDYMSSFGNGGNSGTDTSNTTKLSLDFSNVISRNKSSLKNSSLGLKSARDFTPGSYFIRSANPTNLNSNLFSVDYNKESLDVTIRPDKPYMYIRCTNSSGLGKINNNETIYCYPKSGSKLNQFPINIYSDLFKRTKEYIGKNVRTWLKTERGVIEITEIDSIFRELFHITLDTGEVEYIKTTVKENGDSDYYAQCNLYITDSATKITFSIDDLVLLDKDSNAYYEYITDLKDQITCYISCSSSFANNTNINNINHR